MMIYRYFFTVHNLLCQKNDLCQIYVPHLYTGYILFCINHFIYFQVQFEDPNVIELIGVVTRTDKFMIVTEFMKNGSLKEYLKVNHHEILNSRNTT